MADFAIKLGKLEERFDGSEKRFSQLRKEFDARGKEVHERNNLAQRIIAEDYNRLNLEVSLLKANDAHREESSKEFKAFCSSVLTQLTSIEKRLASSDSGESTKQRMVENFLKASGWVAVFLAAVKIIMG